ncbi:MAG: glutamine--fructose-6-phosphate aminotransferase, partial [Oligoflexia bacterium]|nr:glutamine--fructose-6-phosphate aminotransferase [Oligoflexia bacterium]
MCGIVGYIGERKAQDLIYKGLSRLEYRGYDSSGIAALREIGSDQYETKIIKAPGKLKELKKTWNEFEFHSGLAIGHTRWATHGEANQVNAHPHKDGPITIVHNGIIENHQEIRAELKKEGKSFSSQTDSELFAHMVHRERNQNKSLLESVRLAFKRVKGASAFVVLDERCPDHFVVVRNGSPLVIGVGKGENFVASDVPAILDSTKNIYYLEDLEVAEISRSAVRVFDLDGKEKKVDLVEIKWSLDEID